MNLRVGMVGSVLLLAGLACGGSALVGEANVRLTGLPQFVCPTSTPRPTATQWPTAVQPDVYIPPSGWQPYTPVPGCRRIGSFCYPHTAVPGGLYTIPGYYVPGATSTPRPTHTPYPTPTPYIVTENYAVGQDVNIGERAGLRVRLRISNLRVIPLSADRQVVVWDVRIRNTGSLPYNTLPGSQTFISRVGGRDGYWYASLEAATAAGLTVNPQALDIQAVNPRQTVNLTLTAFTPVGSVDAIAWLLDPYASAGRAESGGIVGGNTAVWLNRVDPHGCNGNVDDLDELDVPTPFRTPPTSTPSVTPYIPPYAGATRPPR